MRKKLPAEVQKWKVGKLIIAIMEVSSSFLCQGVYGKLDSFLSDDEVYGNTWCQAGFPSANVPVPGVPIDRRKDKESWNVTTGRSNSLFDEEDTDMERQHYQILSSHQELSRVVTEDGHDSQNKETAQSSLSAHVPLSTVDSARYRSPPAPDVVLREEIMDELQDHLPFCKRGESFWLQYSLVRDGASLEILLDKVRDSESTILALETVEGEVFGAFCTSPWKLSHDYYGNGQSFLWRLNEDHQIQVFKFAFLNHNVQLCHLDRLIVGGGDDTTQTPPSLAEIESSSTGSMSSVPLSSDAHLEWGFGLWLEQDLLTGSSSPCLTFQSPSLSKIHADGTRFEIRNLEVWALTPCISVEQALATQQHRRLISGALLPRALSLMAGQAVPSLFGLSKK